ncbi:hypothetical protein ACLKA7_012243 [Drosophila subpalustris]
MAKTDSGTDQSPDNPNPLSPAYVAREALPHPQDPLLSMNMKGMAAKQTLEEANPKSAKHGIQNNLSVLAAHCGPHDDYVGRSQL